MKRSSTADFLKGIAIIMILVTHYDWTEMQRQSLAFSYIINMAVPIFMIISGYVGSMSFRKHGIESISDAYAVNNIARKTVRYSVPFLIIVIWQISDPNITTNAQGRLEYIRWVLNGTMGPGSYYYPILMQFVFVFPAIYFIVYRKGMKGLWICLIANAVYELLKWSYGITDETYRLLIFRYIFVIAAGIYAEKHALRRDISVAMMIIGGVFIWATSHKMYSPRIITSWTSTCCIAVMWIIPIIVYALRNTNIHCRPVEMIGQASYNIFLVQMVFYSSYQLRFATLFDNWMYELFADITVCVLIGYVFYAVEYRITIKLLRRL